MHLLWGLGEGTVQDVIASMKEGKQPSRTTVSTIIRLLEEKGAVGHRAEGRGYIYYPILKKEEVLLIRRLSSWLKTGCLLNNHPIFVKTLL
jgi:predicted transcriptional regulator